MIRTKWMLTAASIIGVFALSNTSLVFAAEEKKLTPIEEGKKIAYDRVKGNCLACHVMGDGASPGEIAPPLMSMQARYPDRQKLFDKIWGKPGTELMPESQMLPFGRHKALTDDEINKIVDYLYTL